MSEVAHSGEAFQTVIKEHLLANEYAVVGGDGLDRDRRSFRMRC